ncbi:CMD domain protein [Brucella pituitosa]|uniref:CMD domain protein n=1 Tax=Brucella pituitosa TaxID=571256 RepID=A0ABS3K1V4_9HYPH|nr:CMD domain protein [Brucella pituitosa]MBO1040903.1 CMD domain protein [Brucella pituitosa]
MTQDNTPDVINDVLQLTPQSPLAQLRAKRALIEKLTQTSYEAAIHPKQPRNFSYPYRAALAARIAKLWKSDDLAQHYDRLLDAENATDDLCQIAEPSWQPDAAEPRLSAIVAHTDLVSLNPKAATKANIETLKLAGLDDQDIVTLAGIIAFINYQVLMVAGLKMLRDN